MSLHNISTILFLFRKRNNLFLDSQSVSFFFWNFPASEHQKPLRVTTLQCLGKIIVLATWGTSLRSVLMLFQICCFPFSLLDIHLYISFCVFCWVRGNIYKPADVMCAVRFVKKKQKKTCSFRIFLKKNKNKMCPNHCVFPGPNVQTSRVSWLTETGSKEEKIFSNNGREMMWSPPFHPFLCERCVKFPRVIPSPSFSASLQPSEAFHLAVSHVVDTLVIVLFSERKKAEKQSEHKEKNATIKMSHMSLVPSK